MRHNGFLLLRGWRLWSGILWWGSFLLLGRVQMDHLRIRLSGSRGAVRDINTDAKRPHDVHTNQARRGFQPNNNYEAGAPACFTPLQIQMLRSPRYLERFSVSPVHDSPKWLQGTPLGMVSPPHRESHASYRSASVDEAEDWDALESELAGDGWAYCTHNRGLLGLR